MKKLISLLLILAMVASVSALADPVGMWSFCWDARELNEQLGTHRMAFDCQMYNLYLFDDGSAYMTNANVTNGKTDFSYGALDGVWLGDSSSFVVRVGTQTYKSWIDDSDRLFLQMTDSMAFIFSRIPNYDYHEGMIK